MIQLMQYGDSQLLAEVAGFEPTHEGVKKANSLRRLTQFDYLSNEILRDNSYIKYHTFAILLTMLLCCAFSIQQ